MVALRLELDNVTNFSDGGPTSLLVEGRRSVDIGRNSYLDWTLPDPARVVSGRHCEIAYRDGGYWITDVSTNGTYLNGSDRRLTEPTQLRTGDRIAIGDYLINVFVDGGGDAPARTVEAPPDGPAELSSAALWDVTDERAAPAERPDKRRERSAKPVNADMLDWVVDLPSVEAAPEPAAPEPPEPAPVPEPPAPRPPVSPSAETGGPWRTPPADPEPPAHSPDADAPAPPIATLGGTEAAASDADPPADTEPAADAAPEAEEAGAPVPPPEEAGDTASPDHVPDVFTPPEPAPPPETPQAARQPRGFAAAAEAHQTAPAAAGPEMERFLDTLAEALDIPRSRLEAGTPEEAARKVGEFISITIAGMQKLLKARAASRGYMRSGAGTQVQAVGNNPFKFMPTPGAAADVLFGPPSRSYLTIEQSLEESFSELGAHQMALYSAMQTAVERMLKDLDPASIEAGGDEDKGGFAIPGMSSRKSKLWETYKERYNARASQHDNGMVDVFMMCFSEAYNRAINER